MTKGFRNFDLPTIHLSDGTNYVPPRTRDLQEATRRRNLPPGSLVLERQAAGLDVAVGLFNYPIDITKDREFLHQRVASALMNAAWYSYAYDNADVMRRQLKLPVLADDHAEWRETRTGLTIKVRDGLTHAASLVHRLAIAHQRELDTKRVNRRLGQQMGNTAVAIMCLSLTDAPQGMSEPEIQYVARLTALDALESARTSHQSTGTHESIAQLASPNTPMSIAWRRDAPSSNQAHNALVQAQSDFGLPD